MCGAAAAIANFVVPDGGAATPLVHTRGSLALTDTVFSNNSLPAPAGAAVLVGGAGAVRLERCSFSSTGTAQGVRAASLRNDVFSDDSNATFSVPRAGNGSAGMQMRRPRPLNAADGEPFLTGDDAWLVQLKQVPSLMCM